MTVFRTTLIRCVRRVWFIGLLAIMPVLIVVFSGFGNDSRIRVGFFDGDRTPLSEMVLSALDDIAVCIEVQSDAMTDSLINGRIDYGLVIPAGMTETVLGGGRARLESRSLQDAIVSQPVRAAINGILSSAHNIARITSFDADSFYKAMSSAVDGVFSVRSESYRSRGGDPAISRVSLIVQLVGMLALAMLYMMHAAGNFLLADFESSVFYRVLAGPTTLRRYMAETILAYIVVTLIQAVTAIGAILIVFRNLAPEMFFRLAILFSAFACVAVAFTVAVANIAGTRRRAAFLANLLIMPWGMLGGAFWPIDIMPKVLQNVARFVPTSWLTSSARLVLSGGSTGEYVQHLCILFLFALVFFLLGTWRHADINRP